MHQFNIKTDVLTFYLHRQMRPPAMAKRLEITILSFKMPLLGPPSQTKHGNTIKLFTDRKRHFVYKHDLIRCSLFYFLCWEAGGYFSLDCFNVLCLWLD